MLPWQQMVASYIWGAKYATMNRKQINGKRRYEQYRYTAQYAATFLSSYFSFTLTNIYIPVILLSHLLMSSCLQSAAVKLHVSALYD